MSPDTSRAAAACLRFTLAFAATAFCIGRALPWPADGAIGERIAHLRADPTGYDAIFVGASGVYRGLDPRVVDAVLADDGTPLRTYNLGAPGMHSWEADVVLRAGVEAAGDTLRYAFVEPAHWSAATDNENVRSYRYLFWHTPSTTIAIAQSAWRGPGTRDERLALAFDHVRIGIQRAFGFGSAREFARVWFDLEPPSEALAASIGSGGFLALDDDPDPTIAKRRETFLTEQAADFPALVRKLRQANNGPDRALAEFAGETDFVPHDDQVRWLEARGVVPVFVVPPYTGRDRLFAALAAAGRISNLLEFTDPERYPVLYVLANRHDRQHLTARGAQLFSAAFAHAVAALVRADDRKQD